MVIMAHPDDAEFAAGGTVALWTRQGKEVIYLVLTDGSKGSDDPGMTWEGLAAIREAEQRAAAARLGVEDVRFLGYPDGELRPTRQVRRDIVRELRRFRPEIVICQDPTTRYWGNSYINHADHRAAGEAALDAVFPAAGNRLYFPELLAQGYEPHQVKEVWLSGTQNPDHWTDIAATLDLKLAALREHKSQIRDAAALEKRVRERAKLLGEKPGYAYAEAFKRIVLG